MGLPRACTPSSRPPPFAPRPTGPRLASWPTPATWFAADIPGTLYGIFHINDLPNKPATQVKDSDRLYPGDGILPLEQLLKDLWKVGFRGPLSLEMFSDAEWKKSAAEVAKRGIEKIRVVIAKSGTEA
jgi:sugar phosphate isomerase/epimerase